MMTRGRHGSPVLFLRGWLMGSEPTKGSLISVMYEKYMCIKGNPSAEIGTRVNKIKS